MLHNALVFALLSTVAAQGRTWIVDQANGTGTNFRDLVSAEAAVAPGDILLVRRGTYGGFYTSKGITIIGDGAVRILDTTPMLPLATLVVSGLPIGQTFTLARVNLEARLAARCLVIQTTAGRVHLDDVSVAILPTLNGPVGIDAIDAAFLTARGGTGLGGVSLYRSIAAFEGCPLNGIGSMSLQGGWISPNSAGLVAIDSTVHVSRCNLRGGNGGGGSFPPTNPGAPALVARGSRIVLTGDATTTVQAGAYLPGGPVPGILADGGQLEIDPQVTVTGAHGGPPTMGTAPVVARQIPSLWANAAELGMTFIIELDSPPGNLVSIMLGLPMLPIAFPFGSVAVDPSLLVPLAFGATQGPSGRVSVMVNVPNNAWLTGLILAVQALDYAPSTGLEASTPAVVVLR